jgi:DNA-directed RNA polymerase specialized sigma24 family protein
MDRSAASRIWLDITELARTILRHKSGTTLADDDPRRDNADALELLQDVIARVWERVAGDPAGAHGVADLRAYVATTTHNAWSDHLRQKYPNRASLKNRLRYFLNHQPRYAVWPGADGDLLAGLHAWRLSPPGPAPAERVAALRDGREKLPADSIARKPFDGYEAADWDTLLAALFLQLKVPIALDDLVAVCATMLGVREDRTDSLDAMVDDETAPLQIADPAARPDEQAQTRSALRQLWAAVLALKADYRRAYLLNLPGPGKSRADIEVFVLNGIASIADIEAALALSTAQYEIAFAALGSDDAERFELARCTTTLERFCLLWRHLPLADGVIAGLLGLESQQVINRRMLALRELARTLTHPRSPSPRASR